METLIWSGYFIVVVALIGVVWKQLQKLNGASRGKPTPSAEPKILSTETKKSGLRSDLLKEGTGPKAKNGDLLTVHYVAFLPSGQAIDSSRERGRPLSFKLGAGKVIDGWEVALLGVRAGDIRKVTVPSKLAYGKKGSPSGKVSPDTDVIFSIEVLKIG